MGVRCWRYRAERGRQRTTVTHGSILWCSVGSAPGMAMCGGLLGRAPKAQGASLWQGQVDWAGTCG